MKKRLGFITALKSVILEHQEYILDRLQADTKKSRFDAITAEIFGTLDFLDYLEKNAVKYLKDRKVSTPFALMGKKSRVFFEPLGTAPAHLSLELSLLPGHCAHCPGLYRGQRRGVQALFGHPPSRAWLRTCWPGRGSGPAGSRWSTAVGPVWGTPWWTESRTKSSSSAARPWAAIS